MSNTVSVTALINFNVISNLYLLSDDGRRAYKYTALKLKHSSSSNVRKYSFKKNIFRPLNYMAILTIRLDIKLEKL